MHYTKLIKDENHVIFQNDAENAADKIQNLSW